MFQPIPVLNADCFDHVWREIAFRFKLIQPFDGGLHGLRARLVLLGSINFAFLTSYVVKAELSDDPRQHETLPDKCYEDHCKRQKQDQVTIRKWLSRSSC